MKTTKRGISFELNRSANPDAETLVLAHGLGLDSTVWKLILPQLANYHTITFDFRGHGHSSAAEGTLEWNTLNMDFESILAETRSTCFHFVGQGLGAYFGSQWQELNPDSILSFIVFSTPAVNLADCIRKAPSEDSLPLLDKEGLSDFWISHLLYKSIGSNYFLLKDACSRLDLYTYSLARELISGHSIINFRHMNIPVLFLAGEFDHFYPASLVMLSSDYIRQSRKYIIPSASHLIQLDQPELTVAKCREFLASPAVMAEVKPEAGSSYTQKLLLQLEAAFETPPPNEDKIHLFMLDEFKVTAGNTVIEGKWNQRKAKEILAYLSLHGPVSRNILTEIFWPGLPVANAQNQLRVSLTHLRKIFQGGGIPDPFTIENNIISINRDIDIDALQFSRLLDQALEAEDWAAMKVLKAKAAGKIPAKLLPQFKAKWADDYRRDLELSIIRLLNLTYKQHLHLREISDALNDMQLLLKLSSEDTKLHKEISDLYQKVSMSPIETWETA
ncbi:alpha/beta fold hydrolase [Bacillus infantis]|uniref:alpha/beta hydrolase n=1 Tax=Bacillus infantis TaxID=324767 RepID=UPI001CD4F453|nr:alpha/beta hydrolase [Bacillus infantis]MCA1040316.1 alpha/beta fold hydrolase [Bacillus infantis]